MLSVFVVSVFGVVCVDVVAGAVVVCARWVVVVLGADACVVCVAVPRPRPAREMWLLVLLRRHRRNW